jgi:hypothetical protein
MRPSLDVSVPSGTADVEGILFLLGDGDHDWPIKFMVEHQRFETVIQSLNERSRMHFNSAQEKLLSAGIHEGGTYNRDQIRNALGVQLFDTLERLTEDVIRQIDWTIESHRNVITAFREAMKQRFPGERIVYVLPEDRLDPELAR